MSTTTRHRPRPGPTPRAPGPAPNPIDPRIRARRADVQRSNGRRRLRRVIDGLLVLAVVAGFLGALRSPLLDVDRIVVVGARETGREVVVEASGVALGDQLMDVDLGAAGRRVAALPWIADVTVTRGMDGVVRFAVEERVAVAVVGRGGAAQLVDAGGRVLGPDRGGAVPYPRIEGVDAVPVGGDLPAAAQGALAVAAQLDDRLRSAVDHLVVGEDVVAVLGAGGEVLLGAPERLSAKLRSLATVLDQVDLTCLATVDVRAPGSPVLTREPGCS